MGLTPTHPLPPRFLKIQNLPAFTPPALRRQGGENEICFLQKNSRLLFFLLLLRLAAEDKEAKEVEQDSQAIEGCFVRPGGCPG